MLKLKYFKIIPGIIIFSLFFSFYPGIVYAFFSPDTLQLLSASFSSGIGQAIVILIATVISFGIKIKKGKIKKILSISLFSSLLVCLVVGSFHFYNLRKLNRLLSLNESEFAMIYEHINVPTDRFIDLNTISQLEYDTFKKVSLIKRQGIQLVNTAAEISLFQLKEIMPKNQTEEYLEARGITKKDKVLAYCNNGWSSSLAAYFLNQLGYDVYYTKLNQLESKDYVEFNHFSLTGTEIPIIVPFEKEKSDKYYICFMFHEVEDEFCDPEIYSGDIRDRLRKIVVWPEKTLKNQQCDIPQIEFEKIFDENSKIVCLNKLDCILTQHYLDYLNLTKQFKKVFFIES